MIRKEEYIDNLGNDEESRSILEFIMSSREDHPFKIDPVSCCFLILDMQNFFFDEHSHAFIPSGSSIIPKIKEITAACKKSGISVIYTRHVNDDKNAANMANWWRDILRREDPFSKIIPELNCEAEPVIEKSQYNSFYNTELDILLRKRGIKQLIIGGVMTHLCCETTAREAFVRGYEVIFGIDFTATYNMRYHLSSLINLSHGFAVPVFTKDVIRKIGK